MAFLRQITAITLSGALLCGVAAGCLSSHHADVPAALGASMSTLTELSRLPYQTIRRVSEGGVIIEGVSRSKALDGYLKTHRAPLEQQDAQGTVEVNDAVVDYFAGRLVVSLLVGGNEQAAVREVEGLARLGYLPRELDMRLRQVIDLYEKTRSKRR